MLLPQHNAASRTEAVAGVVNASCLVSDIGTHHQAQSLQLTLPVLCAQCSYLLECCDRIQQLMLLPDMLLRQC